MHGYEIDYVCNFIVYIFYNVQIGNKATNIYDKTLMGRPYLEPIYVINNIFCK